MEKTSKFGPLAIEAGDEVGSRTWLQRQNQKATASAECPRCGHGMVWHPPVSHERAADIATSVVRMRRRGDHPSQAAGTDCTGCAGNCQVCDLIEKVLEIDARGCAL